MAEIAQEVEIAYHLEETRLVVGRACHSVVNLEEEDRSVGTEEMAYRAHPAMEGPYQGPEVVRLAVQRVEACPAFLWQC